MDTVIYFAMAAFFVGIFAVGLFLGVVDIFVTIHDKWKLEHDRRIRLEREVRELRSRYKTSFNNCTELYKTIEKMKKEKTENVNS